MIEFKIQKFGADVATIHVGEDQIVEVGRLPNGLFDLTVYQRRPGTDTWDDLTAVLKPEDFMKLGEVPDHYLCTEENCPSFKQRAPRSCGCHPRRNNP